MFTEKRVRPLARRLLRSPLMGVLTGPHGVDGYTELVNPAWTRREARATVTGVRRQTRRSVTLMLEPNQPGAQAFSRFRAGQFLPVSVQVDGRRYTRCYSPANAEGSAMIELTIGRHEGGLVSTYLYDCARSGMVVSFGAPAGDFTLDAPGSARRVLFVAGGSGITPVLSMVRTLTARPFDGEIAVTYYARDPANAPYVEELAALAGVRVLRGYTRTTGGDVHGRACIQHLDAALANPDAVFVCGPPALVRAVRTVHPCAKSESFVGPTISARADTSGSRVHFADSAVTVDDDGRSLLAQAEAVGLAPESGCRMGICHTCARRKVTGTVRNMITGEVSAATAEDVRICVSTPVGDVEIAL